MGIHQKRKASHAMFILISGWTKEKQINGLIPKPPTIELLLDLSTELTENFTKELMKNKLTACLIPH